MKRKSDPNLRWMVRLVACYLLLLVGGERDEKTACLLRSPGACRPERRPKSVVYESIEASCQLLSTACEHTSFQPGTEDRDRIRILDPYRQECRFLLGGWTGTNPNELTGDKVNREAEKKERGFVFAGTVDTLAGDAIEM
jgi:hypothetical protein